MQVYVFGNRDYEMDAVTLGLADRIKAISDKQEAKSKGKEDLRIEFVEVRPNEDLPFAGEEMVVIMDAVEGIDKVTVFTEEDLDKVVLAPRTSAHEYDLGFQLRYLQKLGKLKKVRIVGLPMVKRVEVGEVVILFNDLNH